MLEYRPKSFESIFKNESEAVHQKRPDKTKIILQHDNAKPHTAKLTKAKI
jgi:hypothetical protein